MDYDLGEGCAEGVWPPTDHTSLAVAVGCQSAGASDFTSVCWLLITELQMKTRRPAGRRLIVTVHWTPVRQTISRADTDRWASKLPIWRRRFAELATRTRRIARGQLLAHWRRHQFVTMKMTISLELDSGNCDSLADQHPQPVVSLH